MTEYLLKQAPANSFLLSERFTQDPLESFFGQQRARGGSSDNPNVSAFLHNSQAIRVQRSMTIGDGGNVKKRNANSWIDDIDSLSAPLRKRPRRTLKYKD